MWITGNDALNRYDGSSVKVYNLDKYFKNCPNLQQGYGFAEDDSSNLYAGSIRGLYKYTRNRDKFTLINIYSDDTDKVAMPFGYKNGKVWCFNKSFELATYDVKSGKVSLITKINLPPLKSIHVYDIQDNVFYYRWPFFDEKSNIWLIGKDEVICYETETKKCSYPFKSYFKNNNLQILCSSFDKETNTLLLGTNDGITCYSLITNTFKQIKTIGGQDLGFVQAISAGGGIFAAKCWPLRKIFFADKSFEKVTWLNKPLINNESNFQYGFDKSGRLWICSDGQGQVIFNFKPPLLNKMPNDNTTIKKTELAGVTTFAEFGNKDILVQENVLKRNEEVISFHLFNRNEALSGIRTTSDVERKGVWVCSSNMNKSSEFHFINNKKESSLFCRFAGKQNPGQIQDLILLRQRQDSLFLFDRAALVQHFNKKIRANTCAAARQLFQNKQTQQKQNHHQLHQQRHVAGNHRHQPCHSFC